MLCVAGSQNELSLRIMEDVGRYRHKVFVDHLGWPLRSSGKVESDEFDGPDAVYVSSWNKHDQVNGVARLLPTTVPYLLEKVFPSLWDGSELPHSAEVWELSRFAAVDFDICASLAHQASAKQAASFFQRVVQVAKGRGARMLVTVSPVGMERLLALNGYKSVRAGLPMKIESGNIVALKILLEDI